MARALRRYAAAGPLAKTLMPSFGQLATTMAATWRAVLWLVAVAPMAATAAKREGVKVTGTNTAEPVCSRPEGKRKGFYVVLEQFLINPLHIPCFLQDRQGVPSATPSTMDRTTSTAASTSSQRTMPASTRPVMAPGSTGTRTQAAAPLGDRLPARTQSKGVIGMTRPSTQVGSQTTLYLCIHSS